MSNKIKLTSFQKSVYTVVAKIQKGQTITYKEVALAIGNSQAYRAVGTALNKNPTLGLPRVGQALIPCHRVIKLDGSIGGFAKGTRKKVELLEDEEVLF